ncbi:glycosyltransferase [Enterococcus sp. BWR-S5]|uniref:glycosyltransferase n=1 Tax=Enterococcus sp. BWR-S5 TaxID=2787714 RepID=UPI0019219FDF|nr:glycosyltransferase [Enterococcus sp. BWR-S5]MBL1226371.1 glycosyltransferase [Enterococcus sp. BWR-S5]
MVVLFLSVIVFAVVLFCLRLHLASLSITEKRKRETTKINEASYTIVQPILSGDPRLRQDLEKNLANTRTMRFIWLLDKQDQTAQDIAAAILENPTYNERTKCLLLDEVPDRINPKSFKLQQGLAAIQTEYTIVLDDDSVIDFQRFSEMSVYEQRRDEFLVTGIPYNDGQTDFWSRLVAGFVNSNSLVTYFPMAYRNETNTVNGMFYIIKTELLRKYHVFESIQEELCDDLAVAEYLMEQGVQLVQSSIPCNVRTTLDNPQQYVRLMKRWLLFATIYMNRHRSLNLLLLVVLPSLLPTLLLLISIAVGGIAPLVVVGLMGVKAFVMKQYREKVFSIHEGASAAFYEVLNDFLLPLLYLYTLLTPSVILWRNRKIRVYDGKIRYE